MNTYPPNRRTLEIFLVGMCISLLSLPVYSETRILFVSDKESEAGLFDLYSVRADGSDLIQHTSTEDRSEWVPDVSPDGTTVAFTDHRPENDALFFAPLDFSQIGFIPEPGFSGTVEAVQWQGDNQIVFTERAPANPFPGFVFSRVGIQGGFVDPFLGGTYQSFATGTDSFQVHPGTERLYFSAFANDFTGVTIQSALLAGNLPDLFFKHCEDADGDGVQKTLVDHYDVVLSPDGTALAYTADHGAGSHRLYVRTNDGDDGCETQKRLSDRFCGDPDWSTDSEWLVFTRASASTFGAGPYIGDLVRILPDGTEEINLTANLPRVSGRCAHAVVFETGAAPQEPLATFDADIVLEGADVRLTWDTPDPAKVYTVEVSKDLMTWTPLDGLSGVGFNSALLQNATLTPVCYLRVTVR